MGEDMLSKGLITLAGTLTVATALAAAGAQASASSHNSGTHAGATGRCPTDGMCLYWNGNQQGAIFVMDNLRQCYIPNLAGYRYRANSGAGSGSLVKNNAASAENRGRFYLRVFYNENYSGSYDYLPPGTYGQLYYTWNDNASMHGDC